MPITIDLTNYNALVQDDGSDLVGTVIGKPEIASVILTPVQAALSGFSTFVSAADATEAAARVAADALKAPLASPALTGTPTAPTAALGTNTTQVATTAFTLANEKVRQVVTATYNVATFSSTSSYVDTGLTATITPTATTSKILALVIQGGVGHDTGATGVNLLMLRGATAIDQELNIGFLSGSAAQFNVGRVGMMVLDAPASVSALVYKTQFASSQNIARAFVQSGSSTSTIVLIEIGA
jgi:hypothetical protein